MTKQTPPSYIVTKLDEIPWDKETNLHTDHPPTKKRSWLRRNRNDYVRMKCLDTTTSSLTPSLSSDDSKSLSSSSDDTLDTKNAIVTEEEKPMITALDDTHSDMLLILQRLRDDYKQISKSDKDSSIFSFLRIVLSKPNDDNQHVKSSKHQELETYLEKAENHLRKGHQKKAKSEYERAIKLSKQCDNHAIVSHVINSYGNFLSVCIQNHKSAETILNDAQSLTIQAPKHTVDFCRAITQTSLGKVYIRQSLETGIKDEGIKNLIYSDAYLSKAMDLFSRHKWRAPSLSSRKYKEITDLMSQTKDYRDGLTRTMWNDALVNELQTGGVSFDYDGSDDDDDNNNDDDRDNGNRNLNILYDCIFCSSPRKAIEDIPSISEVIEEGLDLIKSVSNIGKI